jgi:signal transduction histidine kinase
MVVLGAKHRTKSGAVRDVIVYLRFVTMNGRSVANCVWQDVTEKKAAEAALLRSEKLASVGRMAATVAHEINNPLEMVTNCIYLAASDPDLSPGVKEHLATAERELRRVAHIAKRTLGFYRETAKPAVVDIRTLVDEVVELYDPKFTRKDIRLKIEHNGHRSGIVAIAGEIRQVISNLLTNAIDASRPKGMVRVRTSRVILNGCGYARITVADAGAGISTANQSRIFEPFFTTKKAVGTGLGLWVSSEIVQKHQGRIRLRSVEGKGSVFSVFLPDPA